MSMGGQGQYGWHDGTDGADAPTRAFAQHPPATYYPGPDRGGSYPASYAGYPPPTAPLPQGVAYPHYGYPQQAYPQAYPVPYQQPYGGGGFPSPMMPPGPRDPYTGEPLSDKSKVIAGFLQFFLGAFGVGRFYIGHTAIGFFQLGLTVFGLLTLILIFGAFFLLAVGFWAFLDAILIWTGGVRDNYGRRLR